ncbi:fimbrial protein [Citrobacter koseri]|uniref:fimbrial protein n=1 Tax=Citrobacter koseri TaxID=545 RepID=UPI0028BF2562|nr:fimbrial protein [Citrobacter koseri]MDT7487307.1 fimbrial protein [Citrobacter koseri]
MLRKRPLFGVLFMASSVFPLLMVSNTSMAVGGKISFSGNITEATCTVTPGGNAGAGGSANDITLNLGTISKDDVWLAGTTTAAGSATTFGGLDVSCSGVSSLTKVKMSFDPQSGSGVDTKDSRLLKLNPEAGVATGVGIAVLDKDNRVLNLNNSSSDNEMLQGDLTVDGSGNATAKLLLKAGYMANGDALVAGKANGTLPFILKYE